MKQSSSINNGIRRGVLKQAAHAAQTLGLPRPSEELLLAVLGEEELDESGRRVARKLFRSENTNVLHDLVAGGACTYRQLLSRAEEVSPDEIDLLEWMRSIARFDTPQELP